MNKPIPKSLHTVTVLVKVATLLCQNGYNRKEFTDEERLDMAFDALGYSRTNDPYGLGEAALKQLGK